MCHKLWVIIFNVLRLRQQFQQFLDLSVDLKPRKSLGQQMSILNWCFWWNGMFLVQAWVLIFISRKDEEKADLVPAKEANVKCPQVCWYVFWSFFDTFLGCDQVLWRAAHLAQYRSKLNRLTVFHCKLQSLSAQTCLKLPSLLSNTTINSYWNFEFF